LGCHQWVVSGDHPENGKAAGILKFQSRLRLKELLPVPAAQRQKLVRGRWPEIAIILKMYRGMYFMINNLLNAPERDAIEAFLAKLDRAEGEPPSYERLLGFLSGIVITPGLFMPSQWMQPLLDRNGIVFDTIDAANGFIGALMPL
jgi:hypothetical protein